MKLKYILLLFIISMSFSSVQAKRYNPYGASWAIGFHVGGTAFFGDLRTNSHSIYSTPFSKYFYDDMRFMGGIMLDKWFGPNIGISGTAQYGELQGTKIPSDAYFETKIFEYNITFKFNLTNLIFGTNQRRNWMWYTGIGMGMTESRTWKYRISTGKLIGTNGFGHPKTEGGAYQPMTETVAIWDMGFKMFVGGNISIGIEGSIHPMNTNKLDATQNENPTYFRSLEGYTYWNIGLQYWFGEGNTHTKSRYKHKARYGSRMHIGKSRKRSKHSFKKHRRRFKFSRR
jgi:hypothetical protein